MHCLLNTPTLIISLVSRKADTMKSVFNKLSSGWLSIVICVAFASLGSMCFIPSHGIIVCLSIITLCTVLPALIVDKFYFLPPLFFFLTYFFTFADDTLLEYPDMPGGFALFVALCAVIISAIACVGAYLIKTAVKNKSKIALKISSAVIVIIVSAILVFTVNGTPWDFAEAKSNINDYIEDRFYPDELNLGEVYHIPFSNAYACNVFVDSTCTPSVRYENGKVNESLTTEIVEYIASRNTIELTTVLRNSFPNDKFRVSASSISKKYGKISKNANEEIYPYIGYTVEIVSEETAKSFVKKIQEYVSVLDANGIEANTISFVGGVKQNLYYRIDIDMGAPHSSVSKLLKPYDSSIPYSFNDYNKA